MSEITDLVPDPSKMPDRETVLPSGKFARMREIEFADRVACAQYRGYNLMICMAVRTVTIDDEPLQLQDLLAMKDHESNPFLEMVAKRLVEGAASEGIA